MSSKFCNIEFPLVQVPVWSLKMEEPFRNLFPIRQTVLAEIIDDMNVNGFDFGHSIVVWKMIVVDGHTRLKAAIAAGLETVPVICRQFNDENEALEYAIRCQRIASMPSTAGYEKKSWSSGKQLLLQQESWKIFR